MKVTQTRNYDQFINDVTNRPISEKDKPRLKKLEASMKKYGFLPFPILVRRDDKKFRVVDGQHRLAIAQKLALPVQYIETEREDIVIAECAAGQSPWNFRDYITSFATQGKQAYQELLAFADENNIPIKKAASLLRGESAHSCNSGSAIKSGQFQIKSLAYAERVIKLVNAVRAFEQWGGNTNSMGALSRLTFVKDFDDARFVAKVNAHPHLLRLQSTVDAFSEMYEEVYNHAARTRLPLAFLAKEASTARSLNGNSKEKK